MQSGGKESIEDLEAEAKVSYERKSRELLGIVSRQEAKMSRMSNKLQESRLRVKELQEEEDSKHWPFEDPELESISDAHFIHDPTLRADCRRR